MHNITFFEVTEPKEAYRSAVNNLLTQLSQILQWHSTHAR